MVSALAPCNDGRNSYSLGELIKDFGAKCIYLPGKKNVLADAFSRLPRIEGKTTPLEIEEIEQNSEAHFSTSDDPELCECFANFPEDSAL